MKRPRLFAGVCALMAVCAVGSGCSDATPSAQPSATFAPGEAQEPAEIVGLSLQPCSKLELDGYPGNLALLSEDYYRGPWCTRVETSQVYAWAYARGLTAEAATNTAAVDVTLDAEQLVLDLVAQGYQRVCGEFVAGGPIDVGFEKPSAPLQIRVAAVDQPPAGVALRGGPPPVLLVVVAPATRNPAVADDLPAPDCSPVTAAAPTVVGAGSPEPQTTPQ